MRKLFRLSLLAAGLAAAFSCSVPAHAEQPAIGPPIQGSAIAIGIAPAKVRAPYDVQVIRASGEALPTFGHRDRFYVQGNAGERYILRITNPTPNRVEAVVTVDGLDVIDGEPGDLRKRGYVVPAYGEARIEGFRTSHSDVATFRFSSVGDSYAGLKGKARNVGVIAVAIFEEQRIAPPPQPIIIEPSVPVPQPWYGGEDDDEAEATSAAKAAPRQAPSADYAPRATSRGGGRAVAKRSAEAPAPAVESTGTARIGAQALRRMPPPTPGAPPPVAPRYDLDGVAAAGELAPPPPARDNRPGLGTEFGEHRYSAATFTRFVRGAGAPVAIAELRYNDTAGLIALGIQVQPLPDPAEIMTRETADPFPGDHRFARPPGR